MHKEPPDYNNNIKKTQVEMNVTLSEIKKNLQGTNSGGDEARIKINNLEHKEEIPYFSDYKMHLGFRGGK